MQNYSNSIDFYANQLPPSHLELFYNSHHTGESARLSTSNQHHICANLSQLAPSAPSPDSDSDHFDTRFQNIPDIVERTVPNESNQFLEQPPTYIEAISAPNIDPILEPPPSYDSLYGRMIEARKQYKGSLDCLNKIFVLFLSTLSIFMIIIGSLFFHQSSQCKYIPMYLIAGGILLIIKLVLRFATRVYQTSDDPATLLQIRRAQRVFNCFIFVLFITGSDYIYRMYKPNYYKSLGLYCDKTLYLISFWLVTTTYAFLGVIFLSVVMVCIVFENYQQTIGRANV